MEPGGLTKDHSRKYRLLLVRACSPFESLALGHGDEGSPAWPEGGRRGARQALAPLCMLDQAGARGWEQPAWGGSRSAGIKAAVVLGSRAEVRSAAWPTSSTLYPHP